MTHETLRQMMLDFKIGIIAVHEKHHKMMVVFRSADRTFANMHLPG
jgi:hypothetical protein